MRARRPGVSSPMLVAAALVVVIVIGAGYYLFGQGAGGQSTQTTSSSTSTSSSTATSSSTSTYSSSSSTASTTSSNSFSGRVIIGFAASNVLVSADVIANYTLTVAKIGSVPSSLSLAAAAPPGITVTLSPSQLAPGLLFPPIVSIQVGSTVTPGVYGVNMTATGGGATYHSTLSVQVVRFLVVTVGTLFLPQNMTVPVNSTVYWMRLNGALSQYDDGTHNVVFFNGMASSPPLQQWESYSYQFTVAGDYPYWCTFHPWQKGDITVTP